MVVQHEVNMKNCSEYNISWKNTWHYFAYHTSGYLSSKHDSLTKMPVLNQRTDFVLHFTAQIK